MSGGEWRELRTSGREPEQSWSEVKGAAAEGSGRGEYEVKWVAASERRRRRQAGGGWVRDVENGRSAEECIDAAGHALVKSRWAATSWNKFGGGRRNEWSSRGRWERRGI